MCSPRETPRSEKGKLAWRNGKDGGHECEKGRGCRVAVAASFDA